MKEIEQKLNKLLKEYELKLDNLKIGRRVLLIDFAREYQNIWENQDEA